MAHHFTLTIQVTAERTEGKFAARDEIAQAIIDEIDGANPGGVYGLGADGESSYDITDWQVGEA